MPGEDYNAFFCWSCGAKVADGRQCPRCGAKPTVGAFCESCGAKVQ